MIDSAWTTLRALQIGLVVLLGRLLWWAAAATVLVVAVLAMVLSKVVVVLAFGLYELVLTVRGLPAATHAVARRAWRRLSPRAEPAGSTDPP